jgi:hypothetical protein
MTSELRGSGRYGTNRIRIQVQNNEDLKLQQRVQVPLEFIHGSIPRYRYLSYHITDTYLLAPTLWHIFCQARFGYWNYFDFSIIARQSAIHWLFNFLI